MKKMKRILAILLAVFLVATGTGLSLTKKTPASAVVEPKGSVSTTAGPGAITFYVPETIYLQPVNGNTNTFQYYVDCDTTGALNTQRDKTSGVVYFSCPNADANSISISASGASVNLGATTASGTVLSTTVTGGTLSTAIPQGSVSTVTWTVSYRINGLQMTAKAYSVAYAPPIEPIASGIRTYNNDGANIPGFRYQFDVQSFAYVAGIQSHDTGGRQANRSGTTLAPMLGVISGANNTDASLWFNDSGSPKGSYFQDLEGGGNNLLCMLNSPRGYVTVDRSRYSDISQIPNLRYGLMVTNIRYAESLYWYVADYTSGAYKSNGTVNQNGGNFDSWWGGDVSTSWVKDGSLSGSQSMTTDVKVGGQSGKQIFSKALTAGTGTQDVTIKAAAKGHNRDEWNGCVHVLNLRFNKVDKSTLRANMRTAINRGAQATDYTGNFTNYENAIKAAAESLGNPTTGPISDTINSTFNALTRKTYTATINHKFNVGASTITETLTFNSGDFVTFSPNTYSNYVLMSADGFTTSTASQTVLNRSDITQNYNYNKKEYYVIYHGNGATGGSTATSTHAENETKPLTLNGYTRTGYTFNGWNAQANGGGAFFGDGQSVTNLTYADGRNFDLYAQWGINTYQIIFNSNGGAGSMANQNIVYGQSATLTPNGFGRMHYTFLGWNTAADGSGTSYANQALYGPMGDSNVTLYAQWAPKPFYIQFDPNTGTGNMNDLLIPYEGYSNLTGNTFTKTGYSFIGWNTQPDGSGYSYADEANYGPMGSSNVTLYARWNINTYYVNFNSNGGSGSMSPQGINYGASANLTANTFTKTGYSFTGWNTAANGSGTSYNNQASFGPMGTSDVTLYAQWSINQYTIDFNSNGGSAVASVTQNYGTTVTKPNDPTKTGNTFDGWYTDSGLTTAVTWPHTMGAENTTFYAKWIVNNYNITFDANGGTGGTGPTPMPYGSQLTAPTVKKTGHSFAGWSPSVPGTVPAYDAVYTAQWNVNKYTVIFNSNGGSSVPTILQDYGTQVAKPADPTKSGYVFAGWYKEAGFVTLVEWPYTIGASSVTFYARWVSPNVNITFDANGGEGGTGPTTMLVGDPLTAPVVSRPGYVFAGWNPTVPAAVPFDSTVYTAIWEQLEMNVTMSGSDFVVNITGWSDDQNFQIWTYQQVTSDAVLSGDTNVKKDQWILSMGYTSGLAGDVQADGSTEFTIPGFTSSTENYIVALRVADENCDFLLEIRDAYTPANVGESVITKVLVDGIVTTGYELKKIESNASINIEVVGNDVANLVYSAEVVNGVTPTSLGQPVNGNEFNWDISALQPGIYLIKLAATNGITTDEMLVEFELYAAAPAVNFGVLNSMTVAYSNGNVIVTPNFANGTFCCFLHEPGRRSVYSTGGYTTNDPIDYAYDAPGIYHLAGFVNRTGLIGTENAYYDDEVSYDDGMIKTLVIPRTGSGTVSVTLSGPQGSVAKGTPIQITAQSQGVTGTAQYSFWRYDATGTVLIQDWSTNATLNWTPGRVGSYHIEVRVKGDDAGSYEAKKNILVEVTSSTESKANVTAITVNSGYVSANAAAKKPVTIRANATATNGADLLYKFYVYDEHMREMTLRDYSPNPNCVWTPRKAGLTYTIYVLVKSDDSFGKFDAKTSFNVTV